MNLARSSGVLRLWRTVSKRDGPGPGTGDPASHRSAPPFSEMSLEFAGKHCGPKPEQRLALDMGRRVTQPGREIGRNGQHVAPDAEHCIMPCRLSMGQRRAQAAERSEIGGRPVGKAIESRPAPSAYYHSGHLRPQRVCDMIDQRATTDQRRRLVAAETGCRAHQPISHQAAAFCHQSRKTLVSPRV